jgi:arginine exporter protein ArgO
VLADLVLVLAAVCGVDLVDQEHMHLKSYVPIEMEI